MTPKERRELKRRVRARIVEAATRSKYHSVFAYAQSVTDPRPANWVDQRRWARADVDLDTEKVMVTFYYGYDILRDNQFYLRLMVKELDLRILDHAVWHPTQRCSPLIALAMVMVE